MSNKRVNKAYVRYDGSGRVIPGSLILNRFKPKVGKWSETPAYLCCNHIPGPPTSAFISTWRTTEPNELVSLFYVEYGTYSGTIDWGDGNVSANTYANRTHTYLSSGDYTVTITGTIVGWFFDSYATSYRTNIKEILQWGSLRGLNNSNYGMFFG
jgi:PKD repeat protein